MSKIVLCVDDSATMQQVADITFRGTDFTYVGARTYDEATQKAKSQKPSVILIDSTIGTGGKTGYDLCQTFKHDYGDVPVIILIGNSAPYDAAKGAAVGADGNLPKPWDTQTMLEKVTEFVSKGSTAKPNGAAAAGAAAAKPAAAAVVAAKPAPAVTDNSPPRSATIMGMPTIKMPGGNAPAVPGKTTMMAVPTMSPSGNMVAPAPRQPAPPAPEKAPAVAAASASASAVSSSAATASNLGASMSRSPMVAGTPTKRSALVERTLAKMAAKLAEQSGLEPGSPELLALLKLSTEVVERIVWEVVPELAEAIIRENLAELTARRS